MFDIITKDSLGLNMISLHRVQELYVLEEAGGCWISNTLSPYPLIQWLPSALLPHPDQQTEVLFVQSDASALDSPEIR